jgi:anti-anti-sigma factor
MHQDPYSRRARSLDAAENFTMLVEEAHPARGPRLHVAGELDLANLSRFRRLFSKLVAERPSAIDVDISRVELVETITAAALLRAQAEARQHGVPVRIEGARGSVAAMLRLAANQLSMLDQRRDQR